MEESHAQDELHAVESNFEAREKITFSVLLLISFYSALEGTGIGVALPVRSSPRIYKQRSTVTDISSE